MFWVKDAEGNPINCAGLSDIKPVQGELRGFFIAQPADEYCVLYRGTPEELGKFRDTLYASLKEQQRGYYDAV